MALDFYLLHTRYVTSALLLFIPIRLVNRAALHAITS